MIEIKHTCGHIQPIFLDERFQGEEGKKSIAKLGKTVDTFLSEQVVWLESYPCPSCYSHFQGKV